MLGAIHSLVFIKFLYLCVLFHQFCEIIEQAVLGSYEIKLVVSLKNTQYIRLLKHNDCFKTIAIDTPGGNLNFVRNIKAQTTALNRAIT